MLKVLFLVNYFESDNDCETGQYLSLFKSIVSPSNPFIKSSYTVKKTAASSLIIAVGVFYVCGILQLFF